MSDLVMRNGNTPISLDASTLQGYSKDEIVEESSFGVIDFSNVLVSWSKGNTDGAYTYTATENCYVWLQNSYSNNRHRSLSIDGTIVQYIGISNGEQSNQQITYPIGKGQVMTVSTVIDGGNQSYTGKILGTK